MKSGEMPATSPLLTDLYELNMVQAYLDQAADGQALDREHRHRVLGVDEDQSWGAIEGWTRGTRRAARRSESANQ